MEIADFSECQFHEIDKQDNPAFMTRQDWENIGQKGCYMVVKEERNRPHNLPKTRYELLFVSPFTSYGDNECVTKIGLFWDSTLAFKLAKKLIDDSYHGIL